MIQKLPYWLAEREFIMRQKTEITFSRYKNRLNLPDVKRKFLYIRRPDFGFSSNLRNSRNRP
jgi:hypothetical protein